ncbi:A24 family peptidase [Polynucleobacter sp. MWH-UH25E]|uniref:prepilin peptidase n=1 Tax=Polynucleobacter sp. MWH-UH25E TaxID=1855616 RepID=UPI001BFD1189|nr:A24 family peptidase [Polynucleobacter sp. MWH-UH25E]QWD62232.1 prepilin peptidase [Polynucleobacter sp. MWH-UH25E]
MDAFTFLVILKIALITALIFLAYIDLNSFQLPNAITIPLIAIGLIFNAVGALLYTGFASPLNSLLGAITGYTLLWTLDQTYFLIKKQHGIGLGDAKLLSALGAWLGVGAIPNILLIASISGALGGVLWLRYQKQTIHSAFPFGPFLAFAGIIELLWPQHLQALVLNSLT